MTAKGKVTVHETGNDRVYTDESGQSFALRGRSKDAPQLNLDPRIDLTKPIWEQVVKLAARDKAAETRSKRRKRAASRAA